MKGAPIRRCRPAGAELTAAPRAGPRPFPGGKMTALPVDGTGARPRAQARLTAGGFQLPSRIEKAGGSIGQ